MDRFVYEYPIKVYFGEGCIRQYLAQLLAGCGKTVLLAYGGGSVKKNGIYGEVMDELNAAENSLWSSRVLCRILLTPRYRKVPHSSGETM